MCGIAGLVYEAREGGTFDWADFERKVNEMVVEEIDLQNIPRLQEAVDSLFAQVQDLKEFPQLLAIDSHAELAAQVERWSASLAGWVERTERWQEAHEDLRATQVEALNGLLMGARDLLWALREDILAFLPRAVRLIPEEYARQACLFQAWKVAVALENIGRMEVRGRDSCGVSCRLTVTCEQYEEFLNSWSAGDRVLWEQRQQPQDFANASVRVYSTERAVHILFAYKVAEEVGALGDNVRNLYSIIGSDRYFWQLASLDSVESVIYSHSRWASNGIISEPNCHPVDEVTLDLQEQPGNLSGHFTTCCVNGDVDNYQALKQKLLQNYGRKISDRIGTDAKIVPVLFDEYLAAGDTPEQAFCKTVSECEGSFAVVLETTADPERLYLALKGSGQSLFVGLMKKGYVFASELYGVVEQTSRFVRLDGNAGHVAILKSSGKGALEAIRSLNLKGEERPLTEEDCGLAEITTRDIDRKDFRHYLHKEISESPNSVEKTLLGKFALHRDPYGVTMNLGESVLPKAVLERLNSGEIRRVLFIGQGTAAVAGSAIAAFMERLFAQRLSVSAMKATELSGYRMTDSMTDCLIVAISQSGTTTDTNRTIDMARERGASVIGIVNRRSSAMTFKLDGVLYTSDGRDIEMSVASTKAFYSQVVAGYLLVFRLAQYLGQISEETLYRELEELKRLPALMRSVLGQETQDAIRRLARKYAPAQRDWAVVGSGLTRAAADEIRIKLAELCYKSIATDQIEDKKHIDLSSEPLSLVLTAGLSQVALRDAVKEVAIFRSHKSVPIVVCSAGYEEFAPYAAGVVHVPRASDCAALLLNVVVGHLWGYFCALAIDEGAVRLREARARAVTFYNSDDGLPRGRSLAKMIVLANRFQDDLVKGRFNSSLSVQVATELTSLLGYLIGTRSLSQFAAEFQTRGNPKELARTLISVISKAIHELSRPIDAIKHQAKTITVGISRTEEVFDGPLFEPFDQLALSPEAVPYRDAVILRGVNSVLSKTVGATAYEVDNLGIFGEPEDGSTVRTLKKIGIASTMVSRADRTTKLIGTKEWSVRNGSVYLGRGSRDGRPIAIIPLAPRGRVEKLLLLHLKFREKVEVAQKVSVLQDLRQRYENLKSLVTEGDIEWDDQFLEPISVEDLVMVPVKELAVRISEQIGRTRTTLPSCSENLLTN